MLPLLKLEGDVSNVARQRVARAAMQTMPSFPHHKTPDSHTHRGTLGVSFQGRKFTSSRSRYAGPGNRLEPTNMPKHVMQN